MTDKPPDNLVRIRDHTDPGHAEFVTSVQAILDAYNADPNGKSLAVFEIQDGEVRPLYTLHSRVWTSHIFAAYWAFHHAANNAMLNSSQIDEDDSTED